MPLIVLPTRVLGGPTDPGIEAVAGIKALVMIKQCRLCVVEVTDIVLGRIFGAACIEQFPHPALDSDRIIALRDDVVSEEGKLETTVHNAEGLAFAKRYDEALNMLGPYRGMSAELPRIASIVKDVYNFHFARGQELSTQQNWEQATAEFRAAGRFGVS